VRTIHNSPLFKKPVVGNNPFKLIEKEKLNGDLELLHKVLKAIASEQGSSELVRSTQVAASLGISYMLFKVAFIKLIELNYAQWYGNLGDWIAITDEGILYAYENGLLK
jgi:hypothetical protein